MASSTGKEENSRALKERTDKKPDLPLPIATDPSKLQEEHVLARFADRTRTGGDAASSSTLKGDTSKANHDLHFL